MDNLKINLSVLIHKLFFKRHSKGVGVSNKKIIMLPWLNMKATAGTTANYP